MTFEVSAGSAVTPQAGQIGARPSSRSSRSLIRCIISGRSAGPCRLDELGDDEYLPEAEGDSELTWIELRAGEGAAAIVLWALEDDNAVSPSDHHPSVYVGDLDDHLARAETAGATIVSPTGPG